MEIVEVCQWGLKARNTQIRDVCFLTKNLKENVGQFVFNIFFTQSREN